VGQVGDLPRLEFLLKKKIWIEILTVLFSGALLFAATSATPPVVPKKVAPKKKAIPANKPISTAKKTPTTSKRRATTTRKPAVASWRATQRTPTPDRYKEIQQALASKGYLESGTPTGVWDNSSVEALKKFQADQNLEPSGKLDSLSLIGLGLGPKHDQPASP
jgi:peptidoglycan hydrolase-like protein with peptidoglycan-binding domain